MGNLNRANTSRAVTIRLLICQACKKMDTAAPMNNKHGFHNVEHILRQVEHIKSVADGHISLAEMLDICDTEGNPQNGGGSFTVTQESGHSFVKFEPRQNNSMSMRGAPGEIGSPVPGGAMPTFSGARHFQHPGGVMSPSNF